MWLLSHLLVLALVVVMLNLGLWQLRRLDDRQERNEAVTSRGELPVEPVADVLAGLDYEEAAGVEYRRVTAAGTYVAADEVLVLNRSLEGAPGSWALTPLVLDDGAGTVMVNRGWINFALTQADDRSAVAPTGGPVLVEGIVRSTSTASGLQVSDPADGVLRTLARPDLERLQQQLDYPILPGYVQLVTQAPAVAGGLPAPVPLPELDEGPHLSYAVQWFLFTTIAVVGYPLVLRRVARSGGRAPLPPRVGPAGQGEQEEYPGVGPPGRVVE